MAKSIQTSDINAIASSAADTALRLVERLVANRRYRLPARLRLFEKLRDVIADELKQEAERNAT